MTAAAAPTATPGSGGGSLDQAVALLGESLREERSKLERERALLGR